MTAVSIYSSFSYLYYATFRYDVENRATEEIDYMEFSEETIKTFQLTELVIECCYLVDLCINFLVSYEDPDTKREVRDLSKISSRYLKMGFLWDFIAILPFTLAF